MRAFIEELFNSPADVFFTSFLPKATSLRFKAFSGRVETCAIVNAKSGRCPSDCKFCAQSVHFKTRVTVYPLMTKEELKERALAAFSKGIDRFSFVTSGIALSDRELSAVASVVEELKSLNPEVKLCASLGQLGKEQLLLLKRSGLDRYHHNLETSKEFYPLIATRQSWHDRYKTVALAKEVGFSVCSGGIFGMGESAEDICSIAESLAELQVDSVPVNFLHPIRGTPLEGARFLTPLKALKVLVALRFLLPETSLRVCGGREFNLRELQPLSLLVSDSLMVGNYLTTKGRQLKDDAQMIKDLGLSSNLKP
ncbi:biotin synthase [Thermovibrio ammonificans HB-1]|uniref:Biotin synthase n=1 Tax=Thermovibrio ammonificans (strain DSM 15698 / JCM 12110 / HB-1) TaxID=648996 RepID=E8T3U5_THEA1|nr:biotin synthase BioB [Thermovibrio ammonificans]ADU97352.1 biotin synthase [Thermovibrio ammonificans HB-1]